jgi:peptide/nickel transport system substrate-binding protein
VISQWRHFTNREKILSILFLSLILWGIISGVNLLLNKISTRVPQEGGTLRLGLICQPIYINPILAQDNNCDRDLEELIFDGLFSIDGKGNFIPRLADKVEISNDNKTYTISLKRNVFWHDGIPFKAEDVIFTIDTILNPQTDSPWRLNWQGVVTEEIDDYTVRFNLKQPYSFFVQNLTLKIIPKHIWENVDFKNIRSNPRNYLQPIGTGPYLFEKLNVGKLETSAAGKIKSYSLLANRKYFITPPKIDRIIFNFYDNYQEAKKGLLANEVDGISPLDIADINFFKQKKNYQIKSIVLPRYYAVFWNLKKPIFSPKVKQALALAINKKALIHNVLQDQAIPIDSPFSLLPSVNNPYSPQQAIQLLASEGYTQDKPLSFELSLPDNPELIAVAKFLQTSWQNINVQVKLQILPTSDLKKEIIDKRSYDALLFGEILGQKADLFSFWHSSQIEYPGHNLSQYKNPKLDQLIEERKQITMDAKAEAEYQAKIKDILNTDQPALFLYNPFYLYLLPQKVKGNEIKIANFPAERFNDIQNWYIFSKRKF